MSPSSGPGIRSRTNHRLSTRQVRLRFFEIADVSRSEDHDHPMGADRPNEGYTARSIRSDAAAGRQKWLYVFLADLRPDGSVSASSLQYEGQFDDEGALSAVDWSGGAGQWAGQDIRPPTVEQPGGVVTLTIEDRSALGQPIGGVRTVHLGFLSHVQLPAARLDRYFSGSPDARLPSRALLLDPDATAEDGGFRSTLANPPGPDPWTRWAEGGEVAEAFLFDYVDFARTLHGHYQAAAARFTAYSLQNAEKILHAGLTRSLADAYRDDEHKDDDERDETPDPDWTTGEEADSRDRVPGEVYVRLDAFSDEVAARAARVEFWASHLYDFMSQDAFVMAREDAAGFGPPDALGEPALDAIDAEVARQTELLDGAELSDRGKAHLASTLGRAEAPQWYERVALATKVVGRLAEIPKSYYEGLAAKAAEEEVRAVADLDALRKQRLRAFADLLTSYEHARAVVPEAAGRIDALQMKVLDPMVAAVGASGGGALSVPGLPDLPGSSTPGSLLDQLPAPLRGTTGAGIEALSVEAVVGVARPRGLLATGMPNQAAFELLEPRHWTPGHTYGPGEVSTTRFQWTRTDDGLLVLSGGNRRAFADARGLLAGTPGLVTRSGEPLTPKRAALARLVDVTGRPFSEGPDAALRALRDKVAAQQGALDAQQLAAQMAAVRLNWAGKLFVALNVLDLVASAAELRAKLREGDRDRGRGEGAWAAYLGAIGAGAGAASAATGLVESARALIPEAALAGRLGTALRVIGRISGGLAVVSSAISLAQELDTHDEMGAWSAAFGVAAGIAMFAFPPAAIILALASVGFLLFANTPVEDWLENCYWSAEETGELATLAAGSARRRLIHEVEDLFALLGRPLLSVEVRRSEGGAASTLARYGTTPGPPAPDRLRLTVRPGLFPDGSRLEVSRLRLLLPPRGWEVLDAFLPWADVDREAVPVQAMFSSPDPTREVVAERAGGGAAFVREWDLGGAVGALSGWLGIPPAGLSFACRVTLRLPDGVGSVADPAFEVRGPIGYARDYGTMVSVGRAEPASR